ncbi:hypothetical protein GRJ2_001720100 [Grus japonensis]|uniref:Uncharacterized protein n=1 Tax=Grus japonensis TaxID=30415 RepID=A0ABC9X4F0_GRUJA
MQQGSELGAAQEQLAEASLLSPSPLTEEECQHEYEVNLFLCLPQRLGARIGWLEPGTCLSPNCFLGQDEAKEELSDALESQ